MKYSRIYAFVLLLTLACALPAQIIKIGSVAPDRSPWNDALKDLSREWEKISNGTVSLRIYPGGIAGSEEDMIRKIRMGTLGGAALTNLGIAKLVPDAFVLNSPFLLASDEELSYVFDKMRPALEKRIEDKGFKVVVWTMTGWLNFFSKDKVVYPEDIKKTKISIMAGEPEMELAWKRMGLQVIPCDFKDLMMALQSGMANAFYVPPLIAGSGQYFALAPYMNDLKISPLLGGIVIAQKVWEKIPEAYRQQMMAATKRITDELYKKTVELEKDALVTMKKHGLIVVTPPADALGKWREFAGRGMNELIGKAFSKEIYDTLLRVVQEYRQKK